MPDLATFAARVYALVVDLADALPPEPRRRGPARRLSRAQLLTLGLLAHLPRFASQRAFARAADRELRGLFPGLPERSRLNRLLRAEWEAVGALAAALGDRLGAPEAAYEVLDCTAVPTRNAKRGGPGALAGVAAIGPSSRLGWFEGLRLLVACDPVGVLTGFALAPGNAKDQPLAEAFLAARAHSGGGAPGAPVACGRPARGPYLADAGFAGRAARGRYAAHGAAVLAIPQPGSADHAAWGREPRRAVARRRQVVEHVFQRLHRVFGLDRSRPRTLAGALAGTGAKAALHNAAIALSRAAGLPDLALVGTLPD